MDESLELSNFINELNPRKSHIYIETLIIKLLQNEAEKQNKVFKTSYNDKVNKNSKLYSFDAYAPNGLFDIDGPTAFEIKFYTKEESLYYPSTNNIKRSYNRLITSDVQNIVFIITLELNEEKIKHFLNRFKRFDKNIFIWDKKWIESIIRNNRDDYIRIVRKINEFALDNNISKNLNISKNHWRESRKKLLKDLKSKFVEDDLVLVLGAGISLDAGIPSWDKLVTELLVSLIELKLKENSIEIGINERNIIIEKLKSENANSPLLQTRYIRTGLEEKFTETLRNILYKKCKNNSEILTAITKLSQPLRNKIGIKAIINFNFDDLIEYNFEQADIAHKPLFRDIDIQSNDHISIHHVHGYLPRTKNNEKELDDSLLVFSEEGYHSVMIDPYHWSNLIQLNYLRENTCLFVGLSMTDPNLRRLLEIAMRKRSNGFCQHYAIMKRENIMDRSKNHNSKENISLSKFNSVNYGIQEEVLKELGVNILWVDEYAEIPNILKEIRKINI